MEDDAHIDAAEPLEGVVEAPESPVEPSFPLVGTDRTPTAEMIAKGLVGNGAWNLTDTSYEAARVEMHEQIRADKDERRQIYNEAAKDALLDSIQLHHRLVKQGLDVMQRIENASEDDKITSRDMAILSMAQKSSKELADRGMGKPKAVHEEGTKSTLLSILTSKASQ